MIESQVSETYHSGPLVAVRRKYDSHVRMDNGLLKNPPVIFVTYYSPERGSVYSSAVDWEAAVALAPFDMAVLAKRIGSARDAEWREWEAKQKSKSPQPG